MKWYAVTWANEELKLQEATSKISHILITSIAFGKFDDCLGSITGCLCLQILCQIVFPSTESAWFCKRFKMLNAKYLKWLEYLVEITHTIFFQQSIHLSIIEYEGKKTRSPSGTIRAKLTAKRAYKSDAYSRGISEYKRLHNVSQMPTYSNTQFLFVF